MSDIALVIGIFSICVLVWIWFIYDTFFSFPRIKKGVVIEKIHQKSEAGYFIVYPAGRSHFLAPYRYIIVYPAGRSHFLAPYRYIGDEDWILVLKRKRGHKGLLFVSKKTFEKTKIGDVYEKLPGDKYIDSTKSQGATEKEISTLLHTKPKE